MINQALEQFFSIIEHNHKFFHIHTVKKTMVILINSFTYFLLLLSFSSLNSVVSYASQLSYSDHCSLVVKDSPPKLNTDPPLFPLGHFQTGYGGGNEIFKQTSSIFSKSFVFRTRNSYYTDTKGILKVEADFIFPFPYIYKYETNLTSGSPKMGRELVSLFLEGFWSESSGKLCMVASTSSFLDFKAVLKLENVKNSSSVKSLIRGTFECLDSYCFEPISILFLPQMNYEYSLIPEEFDYEVKNLPFSFCNEGWWPPNGFNLQYATNCGSAKNCSPFGDSDLGLPNIVFINGFGCLNKERKLRVLVEFTKSSSSGFYQPFYPNTTLVGEGYWNETKLSVVACRFLDVVGSLADARIADCSTRLSLIFSSALSIRETSNVAGEMWTDKTVNDFGFFDRILFRNSENRVVDIPELKYEYTQMERVRQLCLKTELVKSYQEKYPIGNSIHMRFDMSVSNSHGKIASGYALPFNVGAQFYKKLLDEVSANSADDAKFNRTVNMSYKIGLSVMPDIKIGEGISLFTSTSLFNEVEISAEGVYNEKSGGLCMVGCRNLELDNQTDTGKSFDCEILLKFQFSPLEEIKNEGYIKGIIESLREKSDPFYFEPLEAHSTGYNIIQARQFIWRMDMEIAIAIISCTLASFFAVLQHLHLKRRPEMLPLISIVMLIILALGSLMPFVMNLSSFFLQDGFLQVNEVTINLLKTVAFAFQFRLLRITWIARVRDERHKGMKPVEKNTSLLLIAIYGFEALIGFIVNDRLELKTYGEVILDGFLLPQILLNFLSNSKENVLACSFYMGNTFLQLLPHLYNLYDAYTYFYRVSPLDVIIVFGDLLFAAIIFLQQNKRSRAGMVL